MLNRLADLRCKEVVNVCDGARLGFVADVVIDVVTGKVISIVVPGPCRVLGLFLHEDDLLIPWNCIKRIGPDIILVDIKPDTCRVPRPRSGFLP